MVGLRRSVQYAVTRPHQIGAAEDASEFGIKISDFQAQAQRGFLTGGRAHSSLKVL
jgi:hypothetical protein